MKSVHGEKIKVKKGLQLKKRLCFMEKKKSFIFTINYFQLPCLISINAFPAAPNWTRAHISMLDVRGKYSVMKRSERNGDARRSDNDIVIASLNERVYFRHCKSHGSKHLHGLWKAATQLRWLATSLGGREGRAGEQSYFPWEGNSQDSHWLCQHQWFWPGN